MPTLASTSRVQLRYIKETAWGTTPVAGNGSNLRMTGESFNFDLQKEMSKEIRSDRQNSGTTTVDADANGGFNYHMQYAEYDHLFEGCLQSTWSAYGTNGMGTTFSATFTATTITAGVAPTGSSAFTTLQKGQWFRITAPTGANDGVYAKVSDTTAPTSTVITVDASTPLAVEGPIANSLIATSRLVNGTTMQSYSFEKQFSDITQFVLYKGMTPNKWSLTWAAGAITDGSMDFIGKNAVRATTTGLPGTPVASQTYDVQNGVRGVGLIWEGGAPLTSTFVKQLTMNVENNLRGQKAIANLGSVGIGSGDFMVSGTISMYLADGAIYDKFLQDTYTKITFSTKDTAGNGYVFTLPRVMYTSGKLVAGGKNQDAMVEMNWQAYGDLSNATAALQNTLMLDRCGAAVT